MVVPLYGIDGMGDVGRRMLLYVTRWRRVLMTAAIALLVFAPQLVIWRFATGSWIANTYGLMSMRYGVMGFGFNFARPHLFAVLFSMKRGLFVWSPILLLCVPGWFWLRSVVPGWRWAVLSFWGANLYVIASWAMWWYGGSFGHRAFVESYAIMALPLASLYAGVRPGVWRKATIVFTVVCVAYSLMLMEAYWSGEIPWEDGLDVSVMKAIVAGRLADISSIVMRVVSP